MKESNIIRFDWAIKRLLRDKANFVVLEGFLTVLLGEKISIRNLLESESNQQDPDDKYNRVDLLAENGKGELILIEVQNNNEYAYFQRMLFGTSKLLTEYMHKGDKYNQIRKIYAVNIVYFALGKGADVVYHGRTEFRSLHGDDLLQLSPYQQKRFKVQEVGDLFPEYYILRVDEFDQVAKTPLDEWLSYLKTSRIPATAKAPGLPEARQRLMIDRMPKEEQAAYYRHLDNIIILQDNVETEREEGRMEGRIEGRMEGIMEGIMEGRLEGEIKGKNEAILQTARKMKEQGIPPAIISQCTGLAEDEINRI